MGSWSDLIGRSITSSLAAIIVIVGLPATPAMAASASSPITYVHDELGRLEAVVDPDAASNGVAKYTYDDNGNIVSISRSSHTAISIIDFRGDRGEVGDEVTIYGTAFNSTSGSNSVRFTNSSGQSGSSGQLATVLTATTTTLTVSVPSGSGDGPVWVQNTGTGQSVLSTESFDFLGAAGSLVPTISSFTPTSGDISASVSITGTKFSTDASLNVVTFNDARAVVTAATATQLTVTVPPGATTGAIEVRTPEGLARSTSDFLMPMNKKGSIVQPSAVASNFWRTSVGGSQAITVVGNAKAAVVFAGTRKQQVALNFSGWSGGCCGGISLTFLDPFDFGLQGDLVGGNETLAPVTLPYDGDYVVILGGVGGAYTKTFTLTIQDQGQGPGGPTSPLPADASFSSLDPQALSQDLAEAPEPSLWRPEPGQRPWTTGKDETPFEWIRLPRGPQGVTAVSGQVLSVDGYPVDGVDVSVGAVTAITDAYGRFLLQGIPSGYITLLVDGRTADRGGLRFASFEVGIWARPDRTTEIEDVFWMPRLDTSTTVPVASPTRKEIVLEHPTMPGLQVHIPAGSVLKGPDGQPVTELTLTPVPLDRPLFPVPDVGTPVYWTLQPGPIHLEGKGAWVTYPNAAAHPPGAEVDLWYYEPDEGWEAYGKGKVDPTGKLISGKAARIHYVDGVMVFGGLIPPGLDAYCEVPDVADPNPARPATPDGANCAGDPVDAGNGLLRYRRTDLVEPGPMPISVTRVYRQNDSNMYYFGRGFSIREQMGLFRETAGNSCVILLVIPGERRIRFVSPNYPANPSLCDSDAEAETTPLVASAHPGAFQNATLRFVDLSTSNRYWFLERRDGTTYQFQTSGRLTKIVDRTGNAQISDYSGPNGRLGWIVAYPSGRWLKFGWTSIIGGTPAVTSVSDPAGRVANYTYESYADSGGGIRLKTATDAVQSQLPPAQQKKTTYGWNPSHVLNANPSLNASPATQLLTITDPRNNVALTNVFDSQGRIDSQTLPNSAIWDYEYSSTDPACSGKTKVTAPAGGVVCLQVNTEGFLTQKTVALGTSDARTFTYTRDANTNAVTDITDSFHNRVTRYTYNNGNLASVTRLHGTADAVADSFTYDPTTAVLETASDPLTHADTFDHDAEGCLTQLTDAASRITAFGCTGFGGTAWIELYPNGIAQPGVRASFSYARGDPIRAELDSGTLADPDAETRALHVFVDNAGNVRVLRDQFRYETSRAYDRLNRLTSVTDARGEVTALEYDPNGNLTKITDPRNGITRFAYNSSNLMFERTDQLTRLDTYTFDASGNAKTWTDRRGNVMVYCYDALDRVTFAGYATTQQPPTCQSAFESSIAYDYDGGGRLVQVDDTTGGSTKTVTRAYDDLDRMTSETTQEGTVSYTYDDSGRRETMTVAGQPTVSYTYLNNDLLEDIVRSSETVSMAYDQANRLDAVTLPNGVVQALTLNAAGDATQISYTGGQSLGAISYSYDGMGRRNGVWDPQARVALPAATTSNADYDAANRLTSWNGGALTYDNAGNLTQDGTQTYTWNARSQLTGTSAGNTTFTYDAFGRRSSSTISGTTRGYVYDGWNAVQEKDGTGAVFANSLFGLGLDDVFWRKPVASSGSSFLADALGSTIALTNGSGAATTFYTYEPYGKPTAGDLANPFTFTGREWDSTVGLQLNRARYYSPAHGRFASEDPIGEAGGLNLYQYAASGPSMMTDPLGLEPPEREPFDFTPVVNDYPTADCNVINAVSGVLGLVGIVSIFAGFGGLGIGLVVVGLVFGVIATTAYIQSGCAGQPGPYY